MEYGVPPNSEFVPDWLSCPFDAFVQNTQAMQRRDWAPMLVSLRDQKSYLEDLLSRTATKLYALRDRQTRNERALRDTPGPRSKRKKIMQKKFLTEKTIRTCENEEQAIINCLRVCQNNINTLEAIIHPTEPSSMAADHSWSESRESFLTSESSVDWTEGWVDNGEMSPFQRQTRRPAVFEDIAPETPVDQIKCPGLPPCSRNAVPAPPPNSARSVQTSLSPVAACFRPSKSSASKEVEDRARQLDKLSISGLLASKRLNGLQLAAPQRRFSDAEVNHMFRRLSGVPNAGPSLDPRRHISSAGERSRSKLSTNSPRRSISI
ncbi:uncharacterized protein EI97DRAFT_64653 [Westerdykella ornata]|uniref:Uncharacterized protein n=1 Tax=Westerdykella ornata TaxID=318751 RepID=A0A6A6JHZ5_WESOR|nr:uncharacterized protein EI97DRAFT_64653 [Westerdykella ornata]KAF2275578.1 hypothetical protein EI97DRAFT_64653 [Westerdykella ornata]